MVFFYSQPSFPDFGDLTPVRGKRVPNVWTQLGGRTVPKDLMGQPTTFIQIHARTLPCQVSTASMFIHVHPCCPHDGSLTW